MSSQPPSGELPELDRVWSEWLDAPLATSPADLRDLPRRRRWPKHLLVVLILSALSWLGFEATRWWQQGERPGKREAAAPDELLHHADDTVVIYMSTGDAPIYVMLAGLGESGGAP
jgi:hypothetical protein